MATGFTMAYDSDPSNNAQNMTYNQNQAYQGFLAKMPEYQSSLRGQALNQAAQGYNATKQNIDTQANRRGLLYSGLKQGAESGAANQYANQAQNQIAQSNQALQDLATGYGNQAAQNNIANYQGQVQQALGKYGQQMNQYNLQQQQAGQLLGGIGSIAGLALLSDKNAKEEIKSADKDANEMVGKMKATTFKYKDDPSNKKQLGILAQDLEKSPMGKAIVIDTPEGKGVDIPKALAAVLAVQSALDKRLKKAGA